MSAVGTVGAMDIGGTADDRGSFAANVRHWARHRPDAPALTSVTATQTHPTLSYAELDRRSNRAANALAAAGVGPHDFVGHLGRTQATHPILMYGASKVRATLAGFNWRLTPAELAPLLADSAPKVIVADDDFAPMLHEALALAGIDSAVWSGTDPDSWLAASDDDPGGVPAPDDVALIFYTSGTTGTPKGAMIPVGSIVNNLRRETPWTMTPDSTVMICSPAFHTAGAGWTYLTGFEGAHCVLLRDPTPAAVLATLSAQRVTHTLLVPTLIQMLLTDPGFAAADLSSLETVVYGASPIAPSLLAAALEGFGCEFAQAYGMTETGGPISYLWPQDHDPERPALLRSAGRPPAGIELRVTDPETGEDVPDGDFGEVWTRSDQMMVGYLNRPEATAATLVAGGWLRTGDGGHMDADGYLYLTDRLSDMIVSGGENVYPVEIENLLVTHPAIAEAAAIGVPHERWGETVRAVVVAAPGATVDPDEVIAWCREHLAHYKAPTGVDVVDSLPRNPAGKVLRRILRDASRPSPATPAAAPAAPDHPPASNRS